MTPELKAKELVEHYAETIPHIEVSGQLMERDWITAKKCAIICVDEILESISSDGILVDGEYPYMTYPNDEKIDFYKDVLIELEKM